METNIIYNLDCKDLFKQIDDCSIDLIVTDPPYKLTSRGSSGTMGGYWKTELAKKGKVFQNNDIDIEDYIDDFYRVLKNQTHCYIMCNQSNLMHFINVIEQSEFQFIKCLIWDKGNKICSRFYMNAFEYIIMLRKGGERPINDCGQSDIIRVMNKKTKDAQGNNIHDSEKPIGLMEILISNSSNPNDIVLDPFVGSGTTAIASLKLQRRYIGCEIDNKFYNVACNRVNHYHNQLTLF